MPWFKVDDHFWSHPKISELSNDAISLWVRAGSYCAQHLTDGFVSDSTVTRQLWASANDAQELVTAGLWVVEADGFRFHDWLEYQPTAEATIAKRDADRERKRKQRRNQRGQFKESDEESQGESRRDTVRSRERVAPYPNPNPNPLSSNEERDKPRSRGARLPDSFTITDQMREWAAENVPGLDIDALLPEFIDYWTAQPGQKGVKTDWVATWRNGMRKQAEWRAQRAPQGRKLTAAERNALEYAAIYGGQGDGGRGVQDPHPRELAG